MLQSKLNESELKSLAKFRFMADIKKERSVINYSSLIDPQQIKVILEAIGDKIGAPNLRIAGSMLVKRMAFYAVIHLHAMTVLCKKLHVDYRNIQLVENGSSELWLPDFYLGSLDIEIEHGDRSSWRDGIIRETFQAILNPLIQLIAKEIKLSERVMWENIALYLFWLYEELIRSSEDEELKEKAKEDFQFLIHDAPGELFGDYVKKSIVPI